MTTDFRALCVELTDCLEKADWPLRHRYVFLQWIDIARAALADEPAVPEGREPASVTGQPSDEELLETLDKATATFPPRHPEAEGLNAVEYPLALELRKARAVLARWGNRQGSLDSSAPQPPVEAEVAELVQHLHHAAEVDDWDGASPEWCQSMLRAADLLEQRHPAPVPVSERLPVGVEQALIKAECALSDIAEGEPEENEGDADALLQWAEQRAATALSRIRPVMRLHGILTSEWPPLPAHALPVPQGEVE